MGRVRSAGPSGLVTGRGAQRLTTCERPDVTRVFPNRTALGFSGKSKGRDIGPNGLRLAIQLGDETLEIEHPLPPPLPRPSLPERIVSALQLVWLRWRERLTTDSSKRWTLTLRRHLLYRRRRSGVFRRPHTDALLSDFATAIPDAVFIQIGANDGFTGDPLNHLITRPETRWRGVLVEPVAHLFAKLSERYGHDPALRLERAAIGERDGTTEIHRSLQTTADDSLWLQQLPSLDPALLRRNASEFGQAERPTVTEVVPCLSVATLLERHQMDRFDLLVIDAEGWDWRLLRQFDLVRLQPKLILFTSTSIWRRKSARRRINFSRNTPMSGRKPRKATPSPGGWVRSSFRFREQFLPEIADFLVTPAGEMFQLGEM